MQTICMEQMLYGYHDGHTLLASSLKKPLIEQSVTDALSDAAGQGRFNEYLTGFALPKDGYYAFARTWYADEMPRPGCVWTHILLVSLSQISNMNSDIRDLFQRPNLQSDYKGYKEQIVLKSDALRTSCEIEELDNSYYEYVVYTLFSSDKNIYICDENGGKYEKALLDILLKLPTEYKTRLSFCTGVKTNRYLAKKVFSYQIAEETVAKRISKDTNDAVVYKGACITEKYPLWTQYLSEKFLGKNQTDIFDLAQSYDVTTREPVKELSKVLYSISGNRGSWDLEEYLLLLGKIESGVTYADKTIEEIFCTEESLFDEMFEKESIIDYMLKHLSKKNRKIAKDKRIDNYKASQYALQLYKSRNAEKIGDLIHSYIHQELCDDGLVLVDEVVRLLKPKDLVKLMRLDRHMCSVLIRRKPQLALCSDIWHQDRDYQLEMLQSICVEKLTSQESAKIASTIVVNSKEQIADYADIVLGHSLRKEAYDVIKTYLDGETPPNGMQEMNADFFEVWLSVITRDDNLYASLMHLPLDWPVTKALMTCVDSYKMKSSEEIAAWRRVIKAQFSHLMGTDSYHNALFCFPLVFKMEEEHSIKTWVFTELNDKLANNKMEFEDWVRLESFLPSVSIEQSWDKCLRLRMAFGLSN